MAHVQEIDVERLMRQIRDATSESAVEGGVTPAAEFSAASAAKLSSQLDCLRGNSDIYNVHFPSHRRILGPFVIFAKKLARELLNPILTRQIAYNRANVDVVTQLSEQVENFSRRQATELQALRLRVLGIERTVRTVTGETALERSGTDRPRCDDSLGFEARFRGTETDITERQRVYLRYFEGQDDVLDVGCGRGEFLELLRDAGITAVGIDLDQRMLLHCRQKGLNVVEADAVDYIDALPDESVGGIFSAQLVEHLEPSRVIRLVHCCHHKLRPGGVLLLETPNPRCLLVFAESFYMDFSHVRPIHPEAMRFVFETVDFQDVEVRYASPVDAAMRLPPLADTGGSPVATADMNRGIERLNSLLYGFQDYAVIGRKGSAAAG